MGLCQLQAGPLGLPFPFSGCPAAASRQRPPWGCWRCPPCPACLRLQWGGVCHCHPKAPHPSRGQGLVTSHCHQPPPIASTSPTPLGGPGPFVPLPHMAPALLPSAQPGCSGGRIWGTGTSAGGPAMPAAPGGAGGWHLPPTHPGAGSTPCSLSGQLCWLPTCQVPGWGGWLCPGQGHPLGCQRGRDTWRHPETH